MKSGTIRAARPIALAPEATEPDDGEFSFETVEGAVRELNAICRTATLEFALAVGEFVITRFYGNDLAQWRSRDPAKHASLRKLSRHPDLAMSPGALYRSVAMYELSDRICVRQCRFLSTSHLRVVLPLLPEQQERLLRESESFGWSVRRLEEEVEALVVRDPSARTTRGGRKRRSKLKEVVQSLERCTTALNRYLTVDADDEPSPDTARAAMVAMREAQDICARIERRLACYQPLARTMPPPAAMGGDDSRGPGELESQEIQLTEDPWRAIS
ncbi:MAG: hypothetical protein ABSC94_26745 [Polyangiaceae bacterium]|jgi:hypothetical protein